MTRTRQIIDDSKFNGTSVRFRGIDGRELANQYLINRELRLHQQGAERHHLNAWRDATQVNARQRKTDASGAGQGHSRNSSPLERLALWLSRIGSG